MARKLLAHMRRQWLGVLALLIVLTGGTAYALDGSNTVFSDDIFPGEVTTSDLATDAVSRAKLRNGAVGSPEVVNGSLKAADLEGVGFLRAHSARLEDPTAGGTGDGETLFTIGRVELNAFCAAQANGTLTAGLSPAVDEAGALMLIGDQEVELIPFDVQFVVIVGDDTDVAGTETSFAILDNETASATGVAAASVDPATGRCVVSAQAAG